MPGFDCRKPQSPSTTVSPHKKTTPCQHEKHLPEKLSSRHFSPSLKPKRPQHSQDGEYDASSTSCSQCDARENGNFEQGHRKGQKMSIINQGTKPSGHSVIHFDKRFLQSFPQRQIKNRQQLYKTKESEKNKLEIYEDSHRDDPGCMTYGNWYKVLWRECKKQAKRIVSSEADAGSSSDESISDEKEKIFHNNKKSSFDTRDTRRPSDSRNKLNKHFVTNENLAFPSSEDVEVKIESWDKVTYSKIVPAVQPCLILKSKIIYINPLTPDVFSHVSIQNHMEKVQSEGKAGTKTSGQIAVTKTAGQIAVTKTSGQIRKLMLLKEEHQAKRQKVQMKHGRLLEILKDSEKEKNGKKYYVIKHQEKMKKNKKFVRYTVSTKECIKHHKGRESTRLIPEQMSDDWLNCLPEEVRNKFINRSKSIHPEDSSAHFKLLEDITNTSEKTGEKPKKAEEILENASDRGRHGDDLNVSLESTGASKLSAIRPINHPYIFSDHHRVTYDSQEDSRIGMPGFSWYKVPGRELKKQAKRLTSSEADTDRSRDESMYLDTHFTRIPSDSRKKLKKHFVPNENLALPSLEGVEVKTESWDGVTYCKILPSSMILDSDCWYKYPLTPAVSLHDITPNQIEKVQSEGNASTKTADQIEDTNSSAQIAEANNACQITDTQSVGQIADTNNAGQIADIIRAGQIADTNNAGQIADTNNAVQTADTYNECQVAYTNNAGQIADTNNECQVAYTNNAGQIADTNNAGQTRELMLHKEEHQAERQNVQMKVDILKDSENEQNEKDNHIKELKNRKMKQNKKFVASTVLTKECIKQLKVKYEAAPKRSEHDLRFIKQYRNIIRNETCRIMTSTDMVVSEVERLFGVERTRIFFDLLDDELFNFGSAGAISNFLPNMAESAVRQHVTSFFEQACDMMNRLITLVLGCPDSKKLQQMPEPTFMSLLQSVIVYFLSNNKTKRGQSDKGTQIKRLIMLEPGLFVVAVGEEIPEDILVRFRHGDETVMNSFVDAGLEIMQASQIQDSRPICTPHLPDNAKLFIYIPTENGSYWHKMDMLRDNRIHRHGK